MSEAKKHLENAWVQVTAAKAWLLAGLKKPSKRITEAVEILEQAAKELEAVNSSTSFVELKSEGEKPAIYINLAPLYKVMGEPKWSASEILHRLLTGWGAKHEIVELKVPPGPFPNTVYPIKEKVDEKVVEKAKAKVILHDGHQTATALVFEPFIKEVKP